MEPNKNIEDMTVQNPAPKNMTEHFTTVTPVSKLIAFILFILLPLLGFVFGYKYGSESVVVSTEFVPELIEQVEDSTVTEDSEESQFTWIEVDPSEWTVYQNDAGFVFSVPPEHLVEERDTSVFVHDGTSPNTVGYEIHYRSGLESESDAIAYAKELFGEMCEVTLYETLGDTWKTQSYYVLDQYVDGYRQGNCGSFKTRFLYNPQLKLAITWNLGQELIQPIYEDSYSRSFDRGVSGEVDERPLFYDSQMLDSITFFESE